MDVDAVTPLLGGISPAQFMRRYWQKKPLLVRQAIAGFKPLRSRSELFALAGQDAVQSRLVVQHPERAPGWTLRHGPFSRRALPPVRQSHWTLLLQGVDLHDDAVHALMNRFRFVPDARLDDLMISYATDGGGVGPHFDSYDVFLLQAHGQRRWRIGRQKDLSLQPDVPLKILTHFVPEHEYVLQPGDMLYLPPGYAHDGIAVGECMTYSIGFRIPNRAELARELLHSLAEEAESRVGLSLYKDPNQPAVTQPAQVPPAMVEFAQAALQAALKEPMALARGLGEYLTEPKPNVWFDMPEASPDTPDALLGRGLRLDRRSKMMWDEQHIYINGESFKASGRDARVLRALADARSLSAHEGRGLSSGARALLLDWVDAGWLHLESDSKL
ncbi:MAG: cupin domain-containing protein [Rhodoferax sp.]